MTKKLVHEKEMKQEPVGPMNLKGSFSDLLRKDYITSKITIVNGKKVLSWYLTSLALEALLVYS